MPLTDLPLVYHREHLYPYTSYGETSSKVVEKSFNILILENASVRIVICPDLGGRILSYFNKTNNTELLFKNPVVKPTRILPIWAFISGGIEFNFPIAHSPTSIDPVGYSTGSIMTADGEYNFVRIGEREARTGMEWVVELGLCGDNPVLIQRTALRNPTRLDHPWMMWTNCAVPSTPETEFIYPQQKVLRHNSSLSKERWPVDGSNWEKNIHEMSGFFWDPDDSIHFGVYHHDIDSGLIHIANPKLLPGKKLWTYGHGDDASWAKESTDGELGYSEIQSGPLADQGEKPLFPAGEELYFEEYWMPARIRQDFEQVELPQFDLPVWEDQEAWLGYSHSEWQTSWENYRRNNGPLPSAEPHRVPTGIEIEAVLRAENSEQADKQLTLWLISRQRHQEALELVSNRTSPSSQRLAGLILWKGLNRPDDALSHLQLGPLHDPIAVVELDTLLAQLGHHEQRSELIASAQPHRYVVEREAQLALDQSNPQRVINLLLQTKWPKEHQRYVRTELWKCASRALGQEVSHIPTSLGEDRLANFGSYWAD